MLDADFSDLHVCTFWLPPNLPLTTYAMRTHTTEAWSSAAIYFYAATPGSDGGAYRLDNVTLRHDTTLAVDRYRLRGSDRAVALGWKRWP